MAWFLHFKLENWDSVVIPEEKTTLDVSTLHEDVVINIATRDPSLVYHTIKISELAALPYSTRKNMPSIATKELKKRFLSSMTMLVWRCWPGLLLGTILASPASRWR